MVTRMWKRVAGMTPDPLCSNTVAAHVAGDTVLLVDNTGDHDEDGGHVRIAGTVYAYTESEEGEDDDAPPPSITIPAPGLLAGIDEDTLIEEWDPANESVVTDYIVKVTDDIDGSSGEAFLHHSLVPYLPEGTPPGVGDAVEVEDDGEGTWTVVHLEPGRAPSIDTTFVPDAATKTELDVVLDAANGKNAIQWSTEPPPDPPAAESIEGDLWWQRGVDDEGVATDALVGMWRYDGAAWQPQQLGSETIAYLDAGAITSGNLTAITVETRSENERGVKLGYVQGQEGLFVYDDTGAVFLKAVPAEGMAVVAGEVKANTLTVSSDDPDSPAGTSLGGTTEIANGGRILLTGGTTAPKSAPTVTYGYDTVQFDDDGNWGDRRGWATDGTHWYTARADGIDLHVEKWNAAGTLNSAEVISAARADPVGGVAVHSGDLYILVLDELGDYGVLALDTATLTLNSFNYWVHNDGTRTPSLGVDPATGELLIAQTRASNADKVRIRRYTHTGVDLDNLTAGASVDTTTAYASHLAGVFYGSADFGANRYVITSPDANVSFRPITTAGVFQTAEYWDTGLTVNKVGFAHNGSNFVCMDRNGQMRTYTGIWSTNAADMTKWVSNTLVQGAGPTYQTDQSPRAKVVMAKRSKLNVTTSPIPTGSDADRVRIYVGQGSTIPARTQMALQTSPAAGVTTTSYSSLTAPPGTNPPAANNFPGGVGTAIEGPGGVFFQHDGTVPAASPLGAGIRSAAWTKTLNSQSGPTYTLALADLGAVVETTHAGGAVTITVPLNGTTAFPIGTVIDIVRQGTSTVTFAAEAGVTIQSRLGLLSISHRFGVARLLKRATNTWILSGDLA